MIVERINNEVIIRLPVDINFEAMQRTIDLISLKEATARSTATQEDIDLLAKEINKGWWAENRNHFIK
jgi:hypothetical protein